MKLLRNANGKTSLAPKPFRKKGVAAFITQFNKAENSVKISGDSFEEWHQLEDKPNGRPKGEILEQQHAEEAVKALSGDVLWLDEKKMQCKVVQGGSGGAQKFTVDNIWTFARPPLASCFSPQLHVHSVSEGSEVWTLRDRVFVVPRLELWVKFSLARQISSAQDIVFTDLLCMCVKDALNEEVYMASIAELNVTLTRTLDADLTLRLSGFNDKLVTLFERISTELFTAFEVDEAQESSQEKHEALRKRLSRLLESLKRGYSNMCMVASSLAKRTRLECLRPTCFSPQEMRLVCWDAHSVSSVDWVELLRR